jgi:transcriptional regulator with XRE-family HTH domain
MGRKLRDHLAAMPQERRERVAARRDEMLAHVDALRSLRDRLGKPQTFIAEQLGMSQPAVSKMEHQTDMTLSALRAYVEALGGRVDIVVELPGQDPVRLESLADLDGEGETATGEETVGPDPDARTGQPRP